MAAATNMQSLTDADDFRQTSGFIVIFDGGADGGNLFPVLTALVLFNVPFRSFEGGVKNFQRGTDRTVVSVSLTVRSGTISGSQ